MSQEQPWSAVYAVSAADDFVVLPAVAVELFPLAQFRVYNVFNPAHIDFRF
jgi:hypothetical protein